jgi:hypothetical protein
VFKEEIYEEYDKFSDFDNIVMAGGTGYIYYNNVHKLLKGDERLLLARSEAIKDEHMATIFANVEGYSRFTLAKLYEDKLCKITQDDFVEVEVNGIIGDKSNVGESNGQQEK